MTAYVDVAITHLTRMREGYVCIAGVDLATSKHVRPVLDRQLTRADLSISGGVIGIGSVVRFDSFRSKPTPPEVEDCVYDPDRARIVRTLDDGDLWDTVRSLSVPDLDAIFSPRLAKLGPGLVTPEGIGAASLGSWDATDRVRFGMTADGRLRAAIPSHDANISVTDLRFYEEDGVTPRTDAFLAMSADVRDRPLVLSVGLGRAYSSTPDTPRQHWLQINSIHIQPTESMPLWT